MTKSNKHKRSDREGTPTEKDTLYGECEEEDKPKETIRSWLINGVHYYLHLKSCGNSSNYITLYATYKQKITSKRPKRPH